MVFSLKTQVQKFAVILNSRLENQTNLFEDTLSMAEKCDILYAWPEKFSSEKDECKSKIWVGVRRFHEFLNKILLSCANVLLLHLNATLSNLQQSYKFIDTPKSSGCFYDQET